MEKEKLIIEKPTKRNNKYLIYSQFSTFFIHCEKIIDDAVSIKLYDGRGVYIGRFFKLTYDIVYANSVYRDGD